MEVIPYAEPPPSQPSSESSPGRAVLLTMGVVLVAAGGIVGVVGAMLLLLRFATATGRSDRVGVATTAMLFGGSAAALIWIGVGSIRLRRWCRPVVLAASGLVTAASLLTLVVWLVCWTIDPFPVARPLRWIGGSMASVLVVLPAVFFAAYSNPRVRDALDEADPHLGWADRLPVSALALSVGLACAGAMLFLGLFHLPPLPANAGGDAAEMRVIAGGVAIAVSVFALWAAWLVFRQSRVGPWLTLALIALSAGGTIAAAIGTATNELARPFSPGDIGWGQQLASSRGLFAVGAYAMAAAVFALHVRRQLIRTRAPIERALPSEPEAADGALP